MVLGSTGGQSDQRAVSNVVGVVLLVGLVIAGAIIVVMLGGATLDSVKSDTHSAVAEDSMQDASAGIKSISSSSTDASTTFEFSNRLKGQLNLETKTATVKIAVKDSSDPSWSSATTITRSMGTIVYKQDGKVLALQGGGVWKYAGDSMSMVSKPSFGYANDQIDLTLVDLQKAGSISKGKIIASQEVEKSRAETKKAMAKLRNAWAKSSVKNVDVKVTINSQFAKAWAEYARDTFGSKPNVKHIKVVDSNTVEIAFKDLPTKKSSATSGSSSPIVSSSDPSSSSSSDSSKSTSESGSSGGSDTTDNPKSVSSSPSDDSKKCNTDDKNKGHGNDCDGTDEDNPGNSDGVAGEDDGDNDGVVDGVDACPDTYGRGVDGCPALRSSSGKLVLNTKSAQLTYLGTQSGVVGEIKDTKNTRQPMDVMFVLDESGSMMWGPDGYQGRVTDPYTVPKGYVAGQKQSDGSVKWYVAGETVPASYYRPGYVYDVGSDPTGKRIDATKSFIDELDSDKDRVGAIQFDDNAWLTHGLSSNFGAVKSSLEMNAGGNTDIAEGISLATSKFDSSGKKRVMVVLSDGKQTEPGNPVAQARQAAKKDITIYTVGLGDDINTGMMKQVASETGGSYYHASNADKLEAVFKKIAKDTKTSVVPTIDHQPLTMSVSVGSTGGTLGPSGSFGSALNLNDPTVVNPIDPSPRTYSLSDIEPGSKLSVSASLQECGKRSKTGITQNHNGKTYIHTVCGGGSTAITRSDYTVYTDGETLSQSGLAWWQQHAPALLDDVDASIEDGTVQLPRDQALVLVEGINGYSLLLVDAAKFDRPPVARLSVSDANPTAGETVTLDASASYDPDAGDDIVAYKFGSGSWQSSATAKKSFNSKTTVTVTVKNSDGETDSVSLDIKPNDRPPVAKLSVSDTNVLPGEEITLDASGSHDPDAGDTITDVRWSANVKNPTSGDKTATTSFDTGGTKTVEVTVENNHGQTRSVSVDVVVDAPPKVKLSASDGTVYRGEDVTFAVTSMTDPDGDTPHIDHWEVDGSKVSTTSSTITRSFSTLGTKTVTAVVEAGGKTTRASVKIDVANRKPVAELTADSGIVEPGETVTLDASGSGNPLDKRYGDSITSYSFTVVDKPAGSTATSTVGPPSDETTLTLDKEGTYTVQLTVEDSHGATASTTVMVAADNSASADYSPVDLSVININIKDT